MRTPARLLLIVAPVVFLFGLWLGLSKPGWSPRVGTRDMKSIRVLCPPGVFKQALLDHLRNKEALDLKVLTPATPQAYFRLIHQNLAEFDVVCAASHHLSSSQLKDHFASLPLSAEWITRRLHPDFRSIPADRNLEKFWPLGWRVYLPAVAKEQLGAWATTRNNFELYLEDDFREVLHVYLKKHLLREEWLHPEHTDPLSTTLSNSPPQWHALPEDQMMQLLKESPSSSPGPVRVLYLHHVLWESLPSDIKSRWSWGLEDLPGNLQVMGLAAPAHAPPEFIDQLVRALARPGAGQLFAESSNWASTLGAAPSEGPWGAGFLRNIPLTRFQMTSGLDPSGLFWERIVSSSGKEATDSP